jgi:hypothetical protein
MAGATNLTACCIILHNMGVSDRIMQDVNAWYDPSAIRDAERMMLSSSPDEAQYYPPGVDSLPAPGPPSERQQHRENILQSFRAGDFVAMGVLRMLEEKELVDESEWRQLQMALLVDKGSRNND